MNQFLAELRRRNVFRVAAAYAVVGWLVLQVVALIENAAGLPEWADSITLIVLITGAPVILFIAWAFELTPEGVKRTEAVSPEDSVTHRTGQRLDYLILGALLLVAGLIGWQQMSVARPEVERVARNDDASVAVLPFADMSEAGDQEYFSDGISEEILNVLVRIPDLKVAGRTSSFAFKGRNEDLREIGDTLDVNYVLEGSVRRSGDRLRITAQLIRSLDGFHIWSQTYDRDQTDIFDIQDEIARAVADELAVSLGLDSSDIGNARTDDLEAYELFLVARPLIYERGADNLSRAAELLSTVIARDPEYAPAWSSLALAYLLYEDYRSDAPEHFQRWRQLSMALAERAIELDPDLGEAYAVRGVLQAYGREWVSAMQSFEIAMELEPNNPAMLDQIAQRLAQAGLTRRAYEIAQRVVEIEPLVGIYWNTLGISSILNPDVSRETQLNAYRRTIELGPNLIYGYTNTANVLMVMGRLDEAYALTERAKELSRSEEFAGYSEESMRQRDLVFQAARQGHDEVRAIADQLGPVSMYYAAMITQDPELMLAMSIPRWTRLPRNDLNLFWSVDVEYRNDPRWKAQAIEDGLLPLWQEYGFPYGCRSLGRDDFICDVNAPA